MINERELQTKIWRRGGKKKRGARRREQAFSGARGRGAPVSRRRCQGEPPSRNRCLEPPQNVSQSSLSVFFGREEAQKLAPVNP
jgi:hypothetical protein